jgi:hypothetical protein
MVPTHRWGSDDSHISISEHPSPGLNSLRASSVYFLFHIRLALTGKVTIEGHSGLSYGPISHSSLQSSRSMCFQTQHRTINHRSAPDPIVYHQERNRGHIINGNISGGVHTFNISSSDGASKSASATTFDNITSRYSTAIHERACRNWGHARL